MQQNYYHFLSLANENFKIKDSYIQIINYKVLKCIFHVPKSLFCFATVTLSTNS